MSAGSLWRYFLLPALESLICANVGVIPSDDCRTLRNCHVVEQREALA